jgi:Ca-activated chloride channel homolog
LGYQFQYIYFVWLLAGLFIFFVLFLALKKWKRRVRKNIGQPSLIKEMIRNYSPVRFNFKFVLLCISFACGVVAVMGLRKPSGDDGIKRKGIDVVFALDVSKSMLANDIPPSRIERAKQVISNLITAMPDNRVGLILFAGKAYVQMPITSDHSAAQMLVAEASPDAVPMKGTVISEALQEGLKAFGEREAKYKAVILISDGEDHEEKAIEVSKQLAQSGLMVNTIGIGSPEGTYIPDDSTGGNKIDPEKGTPIISKLNETILKQIAGNTHGVYIHLTNNTSAVKEVEQQLSKIDKITTGDMHLMNFSYYFWVFAGLMALLLVIEQLLPEGKTKKEVR